MIKTIAKLNKNYREIPKIILWIYFRSRKLCLKKEGDNIYLIFIKLKYWNSPIDEGIFSSCYPITRELKIKKVSYFWWMLFCSAEEDASWM